uniref:Uncharacterized protein n=1 Tax=Ascaris lumbricoides TaxID=6252 RepID=A0A0M3HFR9_ASCLU
MSPWDVQPLQQNRRSGLHYQLKCYVFKQLAQTIF